MNWEDLLTFKALAEQRSLTAAAQTLYLSPPTVSQRISRLEAELGCKVLERSGRSLRLTRAGQILSEFAHDAFESFAELRLHLDAQQGQSASILDLSIGVVRVDTTDLFGPLQESIPQAAWTSWSFNTVPEAFDALMQGRVDFILWADWLSMWFNDVDPSVAESSESVVLVDEPQWVYLSSDLPLARQPSIDVRDLARSGWISSPVEVPSRVLRHIAMEIGGFPPRIVHTSDDGRSAMSLIAAGLAVDIGPPPCGPLGLGISARPLTAAPPTRISLTRRKGEHAFGELFERLRRHIAQWYVLGYRDANVEYWEYLQANAQSAPGLRDVIRWASSETQ
ncbi:LysR family transcriptional regulator [Actinoplanes sp. CA-030573]|uniref:LysR family transcriptional regulator n=1 Tax=Actinoplanes sp. CA-030573 TaxID=3239898 RepID=UPI003D8AC927